MAPIKLPAFDDLPLDKNGPPGNAWGLFGENDQLGRLNLLTPETVKEAASEIQTGKRISLDSALNSPPVPLFDRKRFEHTVFQRGTSICNDDLINFNTQCSTQWDGFRHYGYQAAQRFYGGVTMDEVFHSSKLGIDAWVEKGGIIGRGVFLDWAAWAEAKGKEVKPFETGAYDWEDLVEIAKEKNIQFKQGDILFIRVGFTAAYTKLSVAQQEHFPDRQPGGFLGMIANKHSLRWLWDNGFAAVASDAPGFERNPSGGPYNDPEISIHQWGLAGWGMPLGEIFDLEELAKHCKETNRHTFFLTSVPLKVSVLKPTILSLLIDIPSRCRMVSLVRRMLLQYSEALIV
jgi:hypothetical protein